MYFKLVIICFICIILFILYKKIKTVDNFNINKYRRCDCIYEINELLEQVIIENKIDNLFIPCSYNNIHYEIEQMPKVKNGKYFVIENCDLIVAKELMWQIVVGYYGLPFAKTILPNTFVLNLKDDMKRFEKEYNSKNIYILKKNMQRQKGLKITKSLDYIKHAMKDNYVIVQNLLQNPYTINKRKINMRFYALIICENNKINIYIYNDGFMYYTKKKFKKNKLDKDTNITTGYIDRQVYIDNPLTHSDLKIYLDKYRKLTKSEIKIKNKTKDKLSDIFFNNITNTLYKLFIPFIDKICHGNYFNNFEQTTFQLFGIDVAINKNYEPLIMEINKGPDISGKDERDISIKLNLLRDIFNLINKKEQNGFVKLI